MAQFAGPRPTSVRVRGMSWEELAGDPTEADLQRESAAESVRLRDAWQQASLGGVQADMAAVLPTIRRINANIEEQHKVVEETGIAWADYAEQAGYALLNIVAQSDNAAGRIAGSLSRISQAFATGGDVGGLTQTGIEIYSQFRTLFSTAAKDGKEWAAGVGNQLAEHVANGIRAGFSSDAVRASIDEFMQQIVYARLNAIIFEKLVEPELQRLVDAMSKADQGKNLSPAIVLADPDVQAALDRVKVSGERAFELSRGTFADLGLRSDADKARAAELRQRLGSRLVVPTGSAGSAVGGGGLSFSNISGATRDILLNAFGGMTDLLASIRDILASMRDAGMGLATASPGAGAFTVQGDYVVQVQQVADAADVQSLDRALGDVMRGVKRRRGIR